MYKGRWRRRGEAAGAIIMSVTEHDPEVYPVLTLAVYAQATTEADRTAAKRLGALLMQQPKPTKRSGLSR